MTAASSGIADAAAAGPIIGGGLRCPPATATGNAVHADAAVVPIVVPGIDVIHNLVLILVLVLIVHVDHLHPPGLRICRGVRRRLRHRRPIVANVVGVLIVDLDHHVVVSVVAGGIVDAAVAPPPPPRVRCGGGDDAVVPVAGDAVAVAIQDARADGIIARCPC